MCVCVCVCVCVCLIAYTTLNFGCSAVRCCCIWVVEVFVCVFLLSFVSSFFFIKMFTIHFLHHLHGPNIPTLFLEPGGIIRRETNTNLLGFEMGNSVLVTDLQTEIMPLLNYYIFFSSISH